MLTTYELRQRSYLLKIARAMTSNLDLPSLLRLTLSAAAEMVQGEIGLIALSQPADSFRIEAYYGIASRMLPLFAPLLTDISRSANPQERTLTIPDLTLKLHVVSSATGLILRQVVALPFPPTTARSCKISPTRLRLPCAMRGFTRLSTTSGGGWTPLSKTARMAS